LRNPHVGGLEQPILLICDHGFSSVLAAATLADLGFTVGDVIGGFAAWREAGLPTDSPRPYSRDPAQLPGMGPPEP
jgi:rhodanese-related sulfurtransferase